MSQRRISRMFAPYLQNRRMTILKKEMMSFTWIQQVLKRVSQLGCNDFRTKFNAFRETSLTLDIWAFGNMSSWVSVCIWSFACSSTIRKSWWLVIRLESYFPWVLICWTENANWASIRKVVSSCVPTTPYGLSWSSSPQSTSSNSITFKPTLICKVYRPSTYLANDFSLFSTIHLLSDVVFFGLESCGCSWRN